MNQSTSAFTPYIASPGLQITVTGGTIQCANIITTLPTTVIPLTANSTSFVYIQFLQIGDITLPFTAQAVPGQVTPLFASTTDTSKGPDGILIATVITGTSGVLSLKDMRPDLII